MLFSKIFFSFRCIKTYLRLKIDRKHRLNGIMLFNTHMDIKINPEVIEELEEELVESIHLI